jgi:hypothetical protein
VKFGTEYTYIHGTCEIRVLCVSHQILIWRRCETLRLYPTEYVLSSKLSIKLK